MHIIPNNANNAILIYGTPQEVSAAESMLHKVDILPLQVLIEAVIAEVTLNDNLQYGQVYPTLPSRRRFLGSPPVPPDRMEPPSSSRRCRR